MKDPRFWISRDLAPPWGPIDDTLFLGCRQVVKALDFDFSMRRFESYHPNIIFIDHGTQSLLQALRGGKGLMWGKSNILKRS